MTTSARSAMQAEIVADAKAAFHEPSPWIETASGTFVCTCEKCGFEAIVYPDGDCPLDNMQVLCGSDR